MLPARFRRSCVVRVKKSSSSPSVPDSRSSVRTSPFAAALRPTASAGADDLPAALAAAVLAGQPGRRSGPAPRAASSRPRAKTPAPPSSSSSVPWATIAAAADDDEAVGGGLDLAQQVAGQQHGAAARGEVLQQDPHPADALGVEAVGRLVQDQGRRVAEEGGADAEPLTHAERVLPDQAPLRAGEAHSLEHVVSGPVAHAQQSSRRAAGSPGRSGRGAVPRRRA